MSSIAAIDVNGRPTVFARLMTDNSVLVRIKSDPLTGRLATNTVTAGAVTPLTFAATDENANKSLCAVSSSDSTVLIALQANSSGELLIKMI